MRLRQLARKLGVQPEKIVGLLAEHGHELENEANSKLTEEQEALAIEQFGHPEILEAEPEHTGDPTTEDEAPDHVEEQATEAREEEITAAPETTAEPLKEDATEPESTVHEVPFGPPSHATSQVSETAEETTAKEAPALPKKIQLEPEVNSYPAYEEDESYADAELIKTEVPELEGLKVLGKIELPEPKKPEPKETEEESEDKEQSDKDRRGRRNQRGRGRKGRNGKPKLTPVEYERRKAEREAKRKKAEAQKREKQKKKDHYLSSVTQKKSSANPNKREQEEEMAPLPIIGQSRPKPKAPVKPKGPKTKKGLKKFWAWLNGEYDKF